MKKRKEGRKEENRIVKKNRENETCSHPDLLLKLNLVYLAPLPGGERCHRAAAALGHPAEHFRRQPAAVHAGVLHTAGTGG